MKTHYIPRFILEQFKDDGGLFQLTTADMTCRPKNPDNCGFVRHLYTPELETGLLKTLDDEVSRLCKKWIFRRRAGIVLRPWQRQRIAEWIGLASIRTPRRLSHFQRYVEAARKDPTEALEILYGERVEVMRRYREVNPSAYQAIVREVGPKATELMLLAAAGNAIREGRINYLPDPQKSFNQYINEERIRLYGRHLIGMHWTWFYSHYGFVIGDNPMAVWHSVRNNWKEDYGIIRPGVEITFPFSQNLCLRIRRRQSRQDMVLYCDRERTRRYNRRQLLSSHEKVFGPSRRIKPMADRDDS